MIPNHKQFIEAIKEKKKVSLRLYSKADSGVVDLVCAPMDYGPVGEVKDGVNRYQLWDYTRNNGSSLLFLLPEQVLGLSLLGAVFDPAQFGVPPPQWAIPRDWGSQSQPGDKPINGTNPLPTVANSQEAVHRAEATDLPLKNTNQ